MANNTKAVKPVLEEPDVREYKTMRIDGLDVRYAEYEYRSGKLQLRELTIEQAQEVTMLYNEVGFLRASGLTGAGEVDLDAMYSKISEPDYMRRWLACVLVKENGERITPEYFNGHMHKSLTGLYREAFTDFFALNPSVFESFGLSLAMGSEAGAIKAAVSGLHSVRT